MYRQDCRVCFCPLHLFFQIVRISYNFLLGFPMISLFWTSKMKKKIEIQMISQQEENKFIRYDIVTFPDQNQIHFKHNQRKKKYKVLV